MPLGRDSIKRVKKNEYSRVTTSLPDMENSSIVEPIDLSVVVVEVPEVKPEPIKTPKKKSAPKKKSETKPAEPKTIEPKSTPKKKRNSTKKPTPVSNNDIPTPVQVAETVAARRGEGYINLGGELPIHLL